MEAVFSVQVSNSWTRATKIKKYCCNLRGTFWKCYKLDMIKTNLLTWGNFEERSTEPPPHIWNTLWEVIGKSPLLKGRNAVGDDVPDFGQVSKVATHVDHESELKRKGDITTQGLKRPSVLPKANPFFFKSACLKEIIQRSLLYIWLRVSNYILFSEYN